MAFLDVVSAVVRLAQVPELRRDRSFGKFRSFRDFTECEPDAAPPCARHQFANGHKLRFVFLDRRPIRQGVRNARLRRICVRIIRAYSWGWCARLFDSQSCSPCFCSFGSFSVLCIHVTIFESVQLGLLGSSLWQL